jgi:hypothetical protein
VYYLFAKFETGGLPLSASAAGSDRRFARLGSYSLTSLSAATVVFAGRSCTGRRHTLPSIDQ